MTEDIEAWLKQATISALTGERGFFVPTGAARCPRCLDVNFDEVTRACLTCTHPNDPCSRAYHEGGARPL